MGQELGEDEMGSDGLMSGVSLAGTDYVLSLAGGE